MMTSRSSAAKSGLPKDVSTLESKISNLRDAERVVQIVADGTINNRGGEIADWIKLQRPSLNGYTILVLNDDEIGALDHALLHLGDKVREVYDAYFGILEGEGDRP